MVEWLLDVLIGYLIYLFRRSIRMIKACGSSNKFKLRCYVPVCGR